MIVGYYSRKGTRILFRKWGFLFSPYCWFVVPPFPSLTSLSFYFPICEMDIICEVRLNRGVWEYLEPQSAAKGVMSHGYEDSFSPTLWGSLHVRHVDFHLLKLRACTAGLECLPEKAVLVHFRSFQSFQNACS